MRIIITTTIKRNRKRKEERCGKQMERRIREGR